jgi:hypothetical protein
MYVLIAGAPLSTQTKLPGSTLLWNEDLVPDMSGARAEIYNQAGLSFLDDEHLIVYGWWPRQQTDLCRANS